MKTKISIQAAAEISEKIFANYGIEKGIKLIAKLSLKQLKKLAYEKSYTVVPV